MTPGSRGPRAQAAAPATSSAAIAIITNLLFVDFISTLLNFGEKYIGNSHRISLFPLHFSDSEIVGWQLGKEMTVTIFFSQTWSGMICRGAAACQIGRCPRDSPLKASDHPIKRWHFGKNPGIHIPGNDLRCGEEIAPQDR
jgi:hypothetical protein